MFGETLEYAAEFSPSARSKSTRRRPSTNARGRQNQNALAAVRAQAAAIADAAFRDNLIKLIPFSRAFARTLCRGRDDAEDLSQETIANAWQARASFRPGTDLKAWLFIIQRNAFYSARRRNRRYVPWDAHAMEGAMVIDAPQHKNAEFMDLKRAMELLPDKHREALILVGAGGFSYKEAASICDCAVGTMKSRVSRARQEILSLTNDEVRLSATRSTAREPDVLSGLPSRG